MTTSSTYNFSRLATESQTKEADRLHQRLVHQLPMLSPVLDRIAPNTAAPLILDVGAGTGALTPVLMSAFPTSRVLSLDSDDILRTHFAANGERIAGDGSRLPFHSGIVDLVCLRFVLQHTDRRDDIVAEAYRVLRPGCHLWVCESDFTALYFHPPQEAVAHFVREWADGMRVRGGDPRIGHKVPAMLVRAGFEVIQATALEGSCADEFQWSAGALAVLQSAANRGIDDPDEQRRSQRERVLRELNGLRTDGWSYFGVWQTVGRKPLEDIDA